MKNWLIVFILALPFIAAAQTKGWHTRAIRLDEAYQLVKKKKPKEVIVAVIDSGIDTLHEDLATVLWINKKEIPGNGIDDDGNGYPDDVHGWNFIGGAGGNNVGRDSREFDRIYFRDKEKFERAPDSSAEYETWKRAAKSRKQNSANTNAPDPRTLVQLVARLTGYDSVLRKHTGTSTFTGNQLAAMTVTGDSLANAKTEFLGLMKNNNALDRNCQEFLGAFRDWAADVIANAATADAPPPAYRDSVVRDNYADISENQYGNSDIAASNPFHGTHVAGIIGAVRNNGLGIDGVAPNVKIMVIRAVPDGDEHDKDIALAIRYAVDNGARVINMSFGKGFSPEKSWVDDAVRYAAEKNVLLVHAAGNDQLDIDTAWNFPNPQIGPDRATNWITVGASGDTNLKKIIAPFSNYGKKEVDVFAPGMRIFSTVPGGNKYDNADGTSMAAPVVSGIAALILSYYPKLSAVQLKHIIETSAAKKPGLARYCKTGAVVDAFEALKLAKQLRR